MINSDDYRVVNFTTNDKNLKAMNDVYQICSMAEKEKSKNAHINMCIDGWESKPHTLLYLLEKTDRFHKLNGLYTLLYDKSNRVIACSGVYRSSFDSNVAIGGVRTWVIPEFRTKYLISNYITPHHFLWCNENGLKVFALTFNEYNKKLMMILNRSGKYSNQGNKYIFGIKRNLLYTNMQILDRMSYIQGVNQYVMFTKIDIGYNVNFPAPV